MEDLYENKLNLGDDNVYQMIVTMKIKMEMEMEKTWGKTAEGEMWSNNSKGTKRRCVGGQRTNVFIKES